MISEPVLVDTGPLIALYNEADAYHNCMPEADGITPDRQSLYVLAGYHRAVYMLRKRPRQRDDLLQAIINGELAVLRLRDHELQSIRDIFAKYHDQEIDWADACLLHLANRENINVVFTIDRRHFGILRKQNGDALRLLPE